MAALVRTANSYSISLAITWKTREVRRLNDLHFFNSMLRGIGLPQQPPGRHPARDAIKLAFYRTVTTAIKTAARIARNAPRAAPHSRSASARIII